MGVSLSSSVWKTREKGVVNVKCYIHSLSTSVSEMTFRSGTAENFHFGTKLIYLITFSCSFFFSSDGEEKNYNLHLRVTKEPFSSESNSRRSHQLPQTKKITTLHPGGGFNHVFTRKRRPSLLFAACYK